MSGMGELPISPTARHNLMSARSTVNPDCFDTQKPSPSPNGALLPAPDRGPGAGMVDTPDNVEIPTIPDFPSKPTNTVNARDYDGN